MAFEVLLLHRLGVRVGGRRLLGEVAHVALRGFAQLLGQRADFLVAGAALQRLAQLLFGRAQVALGLRGVAILDLGRHRPQQIGDGDEVGVAVRPRQSRRDVAQAEVDAGRRPEDLGRDHQRGERLGEAGRIVVGIEDQLAPLLDERARERVVERALGQRDFDGRALPVSPETPVAFSVIVASPRPRGARRGRWWSSPRRRRWRRSAVAAASFGGGTSDRAAGAPPAPSAGELRLGAGHAVASRDRVMQRRASR